MADEPVLRRGASGEWVGYMQGRLAVHGYSPGSMDGSFGPRTEREVRQFQSDHQLVADGVVGRNTWRALEEEPAPVPEAYDRPGEAGVPDLSEVDESEAQWLAAQIANAFGITTGFGADALNVLATEADQLAGEHVRAKCGGKCQLVLHYDGEVWALTDCGDGTCPTCPPGLGNLIVRHWCAYVSVPSQRAAIVLHLVFGGVLGPFLVP
jgi:hypothetical protein